MQDQPKTMVPRGGHCKSCKEYTLWGDVIRGCYLRLRSYSPTGHQLLDNLEVQETKKLASPGRRKSTKVKETQEPCTSSTSKPRKSRKILEVLSSPTMRQLPLKGGRKRKQPTNPVFATEGENHDLVANSKIEDSATLVKKKRGRPRKNVALLSPEAPSSVPSPCSLQPSRKPKKSSSPAIRRLPSKGSTKRKQPVFMTEGGNLDLIASSEIEDSATLVKKRRGRPPKNVALLSPEAPSSVSSPCSLKPSRKLKKSASPTIRRLPSKGSRKRKQPVFVTEGENLELLASLEIEDSATLVKKKRGRPRKSLASLSPEPSSSVSSPCSLKPSRKPKKSASPTIRRLPSKSSRKRKKPVFTTEGENLDFVASSEIEDSATPVKKKRGRPRKNLALLSPEVSRKPKRTSAKPKLSSKGKGNRASPAKSKLSSKDNQWSAPYQPAKAKKSKAVILTKYHIYRKKKANKSEPLSLYYY